MIVPRWLMAGGGIGKRGIPCGIVTILNHAVLSEVNWIAVMEVDRSQGAAYYTANRDKIAEIRSGKRISLKRCVICGCLCPPGTNAVTCGKPECVSALRKGYYKNIPPKH